MKKNWTAALALAGAWSVLTGCLSMGVHHSARPVGDENLEVGFALSRPSINGINGGSVGALGGAEGFLRYGISDRLTYDLKAGAVSVTNGFDLGVITRDKFNFSLGAGLGLYQFGVSGQEFGTVASAFAVAPGFHALTSFGKEGREFTAGLKAEIPLGAVGFSSEGGEAGALPAGYILSGLVLNYTHRGKRLIVTPELGVFSAPAAISYGVLVAPSVSFALAQ